MGPISPGFQPGPSRKKKKPTPTTKLHRFEPFTKRIARLKIDPVHTVGKRTQSSDDQDLLHSYFRTSLDEWAELNLTQTFTTFLNKTSPLCENLPQLLHHADKIFESLVQGIEKKDELALEPLLSLLAHLAHDLGHGFEQYFSRTVVLVAGVAASQESAEVVEWSFTCLAWMFKYLSRLLIQDLRPLLDIMTPYLSAKKDYIVRFSAESLAFLLRKAAVLYPKRKAPLTLAVQHLLDSLTGDEGSAPPISYKTGVMTLFVESAIGIDGQLHTCAESLVRCLLVTAASMGVQEQVQSTVEGTLIALIHDTNAAGFRPVSEVVLETVRHCSSSHEVGQITFAVRLLTVLLGTRKGSRISTWADAIGTFLDTAKAASQTEGAMLQISRDLVANTAEIIQFAPMDQLLPFSQRLLDFASENFSTRQFFGFCTLCAELGKERFVDLVLPRLQQYISTRWSDDEVGVHYVLERLRQDGFLQRPAATTVRPMGGLETSVLESLSAESVTDGNTSVEQLAGRVHLIKNMGLLENSKQFPRLVTVYRNWLEKALHETGNDPDLRRRVILGWAFDTYLDMVPDNDSELEGLVSQALGTSPIHFRMPVFIHASCHLMAKASGVGEFQSRTSEGISYVLVQNLLSPSMPLKKESLQLLCFLADSDVKTWVSETVDLMLEIFETPYTPAEARKIAMLLRRLPQRQKEMTAESPFQNLVPFFCLGLLTHYHDQTRKEVCSVLAQMVETTPIEESVLNVAIQWLQAPPDIAPPSHGTSEQALSRPSAFECTHLAMLESLCSTISDDFICSNERLLAMAESDHRLETTRTPESCRSLALNVLTAIPASAERRSRLLVPVFLAAPMNRGQMLQKPSSDASMSSHTLSPDLDDHEWSLADRKALLTLFTKFINPRVLFRSGEIHDKLVDILSNGNSEVRKLALKAVLTWKDPILIRHETALLDVAEEKSATADVTALLSDDGEQDAGSNDRAILLPILLRLVFGLIVNRSGSTGAQDAKRKSILRTLFRLREHETAMFLDIALGKLRDVKVGRPLPQNSGGLDQVHVPEDQQYGFLRLLLSMLETLQSQFGPYGPQVVDAVVFCIINASRQPHAIGKPAGSATPFSRNTRRTGYQCLVLLFEHCPAVDWRLYLPALFTDAISPRLEIFSSETNQGISGLMRLFACWARSSDQISFLGDYDKRVPSSLWSCLAAPTSQNEVKLFVLNEIVLPWSTQADDESIEPNHGRVLLQAESDGLLKALTTLLARTPTKEILSAITSVLPPLASLANSSESRMSTVTLLTSLLRDPSLKIPPNVKSQLLLSIHSFLAASDDALDEGAWTILYSLVSSLFNYFKDIPNRQVLCQMLDILSSSNDLAGQAARLCTNLNAVSTERLDEINYDTRLQAFQSIHLLRAEENKVLWEPIIYNLLFFVRTHDDFSIRSNALGCLKYFIVEACQAEQADLIELIMTAILPVAKKSVKNESEHVRADFVSLIGLIVQNVSGNQELLNMKPLLVGNDEEASFFSNILHIQQHRRVRAIRRLVAEIEKGSISTQNSTEIFIPLLEMFVQDHSTDESAQSTKGQSITAMGTLLQWIDWKHFKMIFRKYKNDIDVHDGNQKATSRLLGHAADALIAAKSCRALGINPKQEHEHAVPHLAKSLPDNSIVEQELRSQFIPKLAELIHYKDETEMSFRLPVAVTAIKLVTMLPADEVPSIAAPIILDIAHILRSRTQESRDAARNALCQIVLLLGPSSLQFVLKEMRTALTRGYQLHVVSYTLHSILVAIVAGIQHGDLDYCSDDLVSVIMDDIFGAVGQEKDNQDYISTMKEVKSNKSYDSMELLAKSISAPSVSTLVSPIQTLLSGSLTAKQARQIDELLRRMGMGLSQNPSASKRDLLTFAYQLIQGLYQQKNKVPVKKTNDDKNRQRYLIQLSSANRMNASRSSALLYKLARFALDMVRSTLQKHTDILTAENVHGFLPVIGDALVEGQEDVKISALRLLSVIIKLPMPALEENASLYVAEAVKMVKNSTSTNEEAAQAALKLIAAVLRERKSVKVKDSDIGSLLHRIAPDIEEPDRQGVTFNFIRAVMSRKIQLPEIYELADKIGIMMVTNQTKGARDIARGVYVNFLLEYPQTSARWSKQQKFLLKNLEYDYPEGRQSVMEAINTLVVKTKGEAAQELISSVFIPVLLRMANDDNTGCRELASVLLGQIFVAADRSHLTEILLPLKSWIDQDENQALQRISTQAYSVLLGTGINLQREEVDHIRDSITKALKAPSTGDGDEWELQFQALLLLLKLAESNPRAALSKDQAGLWSSVWELLGHHNVWVQSTSASLIHTFLGHCVSAYHSKLPLTSEYGLSLNSNAFLQVLKSSVRILRRTQGNEDLSTQMVQLLLFLGQCMDVNGLTMQVAQKSGSDDEEEDSGSDDDAPKKTKSIPAIQYLLDQTTRILRVELTTLTSGACLPKKSSLTLLSNLLPSLTEQSLPRSHIHDILLPLQHLTDPNTIPPRSADPAFAETYQSLIELAHEVMEKVQTKLGDAEYVKALTEVSKIMRERREGRRVKRRIERVAEPERAAREKKRKSDRKKERKREIGKTFQKRRREMGM